MGRDAITVSPQVRTYAQSLGTVGQSWLDALPNTARRACDEWGLRLGEVLPGGSRSYVCRAITRDGQRAVLKLALPEPIFESQITTLLRARGRGYVRVLAHDLEHGALLMESLGASVDAAMTAAASTLAITARTLRDAWQDPAQTGVPAPSAANHKAAGLHALVQSLAATAIDLVSEAVLEQALRYAQTRLEARDPERQVIVHGDPHTENLLRVEHPRRGAETGFVFVDPEGFRCEPEYDLGVVLRDWNVVLATSANPRATVREWCETLARATQTDAKAIWEWAYLERVSTGLYLHHHGLHQLAAPFLASANALLEG